MFVSYPSARGELCDEGHTWSFCRSAECHNPLVAKIEMRVIPEPSEGTREVWSAKHAGSMATKGVGPVTFLCGKCRDVLVQRRDPDEWISHAYDPDTDEFMPLYRVRDVVFRCKGCGAFNEVGDGPPQT